MCLNYGWSAGNGLRLEKIDDVSKTCCRAACSSFKNSLDVTLWLVLYLHSSHEEGYIFARLE